MKNTIQLLAVYCAWLTLTACGGDNASAPLEPQVSTYDETAENNRKAAQAGEADNTDNEPEEAEPAYEGETPAQPAGKSVTAAGVTITVGAPLAETIRRAGKVTWDYNADYGVTCNIGNVWIVIPDEDLTEKGQSIINAILSDMENNISFSADYIRPEAKIKSFETN